MYDFIIIGQGLAGTLLAFNLMRKQQQVLVVNNENFPSSSLASVGLFNPVTGKRMTKTWKAEELFPHLALEYREIESFLNESFINFLPIFKPFSSVSEQNEWLTKAEDNEYKSFINANIPAEKYSKFLNHENGGFETLQSGFLRVDKLIGAFRKYMIEKNQYINTALNYEDIRFNHDSVDIGNLATGRFLIFCEGFNAVQNPFFNYLPFSGLKGETLDLEIEDYTRDVILNKSAFIVPWSDQVYKAGSTYERNFKDSEPSREGEEHIVKKVKSFFKPEFRIVGRKSGIRPTTSDRRPFLGLHPKQKTIGIFNGLGTKGVSLAPFFASQLTGHLLNQEVLDPEVDISRFSHLYSGV